MGDHFVFLVNRLITESTLEAAIESGKQFLTENSTAKVGFPKKHLGNESSLMKMMECRICQDEDEISNMEAPCSCCGSLKYAHRKCVQRWCNEKGDIVCEICQQQFKPGYRAPPRLFQYTGIPLNLRRNWEISRGDLRNPRFIAMVATDHDFVDDEEDDYSSATTRSMICCRSVAVIFVALLVLRHTLPIIVNRAENYPFTLFILLLLRIAGVLIPVYIMARAVSSICRRRQVQESYESTQSTPNESAQPQSYVINVR